MKNQFIFLLIIANSFFLNAQENTKLCDENQSKINQLIDENKIENALDLVSDVLKNCPTTANEKFYQNVEKVISYKLEFAKNDKSKNDLIQDLIKIYDSYDKKFPDNTNENAVKKAIYLNDNNIGTKTDVYNILNKAFKSSPENFKNPRAFYIYFELFEKQSKEPNSTIKLDDLISKNIEINQKNNLLQQKIASEIEILEQPQIIKRSEIKSKKADLQALQIAETAYNGILQNYLTCNNLKDFAVKNFDKNTTNDFWNKYVSMLLFDRNCYNTEIFAKLAKQSNELNSTSKSNYYLGFSSFAAGDVEKTTTFFNEAANKENDIRKKAEIYYTVATTVFGMTERANAINYIKKAIATDSHFGKPYLYLANLYQESVNECAKTEFDKKAFNWLLASTVEKAGIADEYYKKTTQKQIASYLKKVPTKAEILKAKKAGKTIKFDCFINENIEVPSK